jgi:hypothetical protein
VERAAGPGKSTADQYTAVIEIAIQFERTVANSSGTGRKEQANNRLPD